MSLAPHFDRLTKLSEPVNDCDTQTVCVLLLHHLKDTDLTLLLGWAAVLEEGVGRPRPLPERGSLYHSDVGRRDVTVRCGDSSCGVSAAGVIGPAAGLPGESPGTVLSSCHGSRALTLSLSPHFRRAGSRTSHLHLAMFHPLAGV